MKKTTVAGAMLLLLAGVGTAGAITLPSPLTSAYQYGDAYSYSLPILANYYDLQYGGGVGPGNPFYVKSTPGEIKDLVVVGTGADGKPVTTNIPGMDNAYETPSGSATTFTMTATNDPGGFINGNGKWDTSLTALMAGFADGQFPIIFFNNNESDKNGQLLENSEQTLQVWGQLTLTGAGKTTLYFDLNNNGGIGGIPGPLSNVAAYTSTGAGPASPADFVTSGGSICVDNTSGNVVPCGSANSHTIKHNLGADQAAYAVIFPELNAILAMPNFGGYDTLSAEIRMTDLNGGGEQIFIEAGQFGTPVPEPGTFALVGAGLVGLGLLGRRKLRK